MRKNSHYINQRKYNILYMTAVLSITLLGYLWLKEAARNVQAEEFISPLSDVKVIEVEVEKPVAVPVPVGCETEKCKIMAYIVEKFQDDAADMISIIRTCENSSFNQEATNYNRNGTTDHGIAQINSIHEKTCGTDFKTNWKANIDCAYKIYKNSGESFRPWACSHVIGVKSFWQ